MKVCGIDLKGNEAIIVSLEGDAAKCALIHSNVKKIKLIDSLDQLEVNRFSAKIRAFLEEQEFDHVGIKARATKGRFAGGSASFKMEGIIQLADVSVEVIHGATVKSKIKNYQSVVESVDVLAYQKEALSVAVYLLVAN